MAAILSLTAMSAPVVAQSTKSIVIRDIGSFYIPGREVSVRSAPKRPRLGSANQEVEIVDPNGDFEVQQTYVQYVKLVKPRSRWPILFLPGGSVSGVTYESTPDGRPGWQLEFLRAGYSTYVADTWQAGRAPWARYPEINAQEPQFRPKAFLWETFRIGPPRSYALTREQRKAYPGTRFPVHAFDKFALQAFPRFQAPAADDRLLPLALFERVCPCVLVAHSAAGPAAFQIAHERPDLVKAVIAIEPSGGLGLEKRRSDRVQLAPHLIMWGDHVNADDSWKGLYRSALEYSDAIRAVGAPVSWINLPTEGVRGNSHMLMMDDNSAEIAARIHRWIDTNVK